MRMISIIKTMMRAHPTQNTYIAYGKSLLLFTHLQTNRHHWQCNVTYLCVCVCVRKYKYKHSIYKCVLCIIICDRYSTTLIKLIACSLIHNSNANRYASENYDGQIEFMWMQTIYLSISIEYTMHTYTIYYLRIYKTYLRAECRDVLLSSSRLLPSRAFIYLPMAHAYVHRAFYLSLFLDPKEAQLKKIELRKWCVRFRSV